MSPEISRYAQMFAGLEYASPGPGILEIVISAPEKRNAVDEIMHRSLARIWTEIDADPAVNVVLVRGAGAHFSAGGDFSMIERLLDDEETLLRVWKETSDLVYGVVNCSKPVVSAIQGSAVGAGLAVALLADIAIAGRSARFLDGHTRLGLAAGDHAVMIWPLLCGLAKARYHLFLNDAISGEEAERIGLVARCVDDDVVHSTALEAARRIAASNPIAVRSTKHALNNWLRLAGPSFDASLTMEFLGFRLADTRRQFSALKDNRSGRRP
jgi:enoyl-CoA hydratase